MQKDKVRRKEVTAAVDGPEQSSVAELGEPDLQNEQIARYFEHYLKVLAPWYDLNDFDNSFRAIVGRRAQHSPLLLSAIVAFAAIHKSRTGHAASKSVAEGHHAYCLRLLIGLDGCATAVTEGTALAATCLLRSYEILAGKGRSPISRYLLM